MFEIPTKISCFAALFCGEGRCCALHQFLVMKPALLCFIEHYTNVFVGLNEPNKEVFLFDETCK